MQKLKDIFSIAIGWLAAAAIAVFWLLSRRSPVPKTPHVAPKSVPEKDEDVIAEAIKEGIIKP